LVRSVSASSLRSSKGLSGFGCLGILIVCRVRLLGRL
jgi:hypothetical protein